MRTLKKRNKCITNAVGESIIIIDKERCVLYINEQAQNFLGAKPDKILGRKFNEIFDVEDRENLLGEMYPLGNDSPKNSRKCFININGELKATNIKMNKIS